MPELPDVEVFRQYAESTALHRRIDAVRTRDQGMLEAVSASRLKDDLEGRHFVSVLRYGKYLFLEVDGGHWLAIHFGMTGFLKYFKHPDKEPAHSRLLLRFSDGYHLAYDCRRKLGQITLTDDIQAFIREKGLGPDPYGPNFDRERLKKIMKGSGASIKSALMNQELMAGVGNVYSDEILFHAGIAPETRAGGLGDGDLETLFSSMEHVLETAIEARADPEQMPSSFIIPHRKRGGKCPKCGEDIAKKKISGRTAYYCPGCQK